MGQIVRRKAGDFIGPKPEILAPAGNKEAFLAALTAKADAVYCGLKSFSARMAARNFTVPELTALTDLAHRRGVKVYLTLNTLLTSADLPHIGKQLDQTLRAVQPDALIFQDLGLIELTRQMGFKGELHLSTLGNMSLVQALPRLTKSFGIQRAVIPRELNVEEIKAMAEHCPRDLGLEVFIHGALCYGVSGRCYWSSYMGGKSGLRGRCVQPCRRRYKQGNFQGCYFACQDLSLDVLVKVLASIAQIRAWKIEGRKKGPHYVYYTVSAYKMLRDEGHDPQIKKSAIQLLQQALGRPATHYYFLPQRPQEPVREDDRCASGLLAGTVRGSMGKLYIEPRLDLLPQDKLRVGYENDPWHQTFDVVKGIPKKGRLFFHTVKSKRAPVKGTPVFLIDRREPFLAKLLQRLNDQLHPSPKTLAETYAFTLRLPTGSPKKPISRKMQVFRSTVRRSRRASSAIWLDVVTLKRVHKDQYERLWWWLPPVTWPDDEPQWKQLVQQVLQNGARRFVLNAPWQIALFRWPSHVKLWAGPFCNIANPLAVRTLKRIGFQGAIISPELGRTDVEALPVKSVLPLGIVIFGFWPFCVSRVPAQKLKPGQLFVSPYGEQGWLRNYGSLNWLYPNWPIDLTDYQNRLTKAGYQLFVHLDEPLPKSVSIKKRPGHWNWDIGLK